ncbi:MULTISPECIES: hypothetical protein [unclassified Rhodococcus (in: high G+C Gram-positive bacteria)]|uniref:hypothetical protein n=1 Tax=unclassified Rhodococcus (in: high G+C Gram-positive bacteria) TaxID=192944 RepID=UPI0012F6785B|nr:hypothetical protein [Rhodococcus sp. DK17]
MDREKLRHDFIVGLIVTVVGGLILTGIVGTIATLTGRWSNISSYADDNQEHPLVILLGWFVALLFGIAVAGVSGWVAVAFCKSLFADLEERRNVRALVSALICVAACVVFFWGAKFTIKIIGIASDALIYS